ncbi:hypothetical protein FRC11_001427 [Ceratobasidium sp. 423]|nr:hypothetical protein FRC11_001427 [Ceratobasidium sp. 423]
MAFAASALPNTIRLTDGHTLSATLLRMTSGWNVVPLDLNDCLGNIDGKLSWGAKGFSLSATNIGFRIDTSNAPAQVLLSATLKKENGIWVEDVIDLNECIANFDGKLTYVPRLEVLPQVPAPAYQDETLPPEQAKGTIVTLPPNSTLCTAFAAIFTEPNGRQLRFTACPIIAIPSFSAEVTLHYHEISEASSTRSFGGVASKAEISLYLDNGVRIVGTITQGGPDTEVTIAGSGHWGISR